MEIVKFFAPENLKVLASQLIESVEQGNEDALLIYSRAKHLDAFSKTLTDALKEKAINEAERYGKGFEFDGYKVEVRNGSNRYDYEFDSEYKELSAKLAERKAVLDLAIKQAPNELVVNGELIPVCPVKTYGYSQIVLTAKK